MTIIKRIHKTEYEKVFIVRAENNNFDGIMFHSKQELQDFADKNNIKLSLKNRRGN